MSAKFGAIGIAIALQLGAIAGLILIVNKDNSTVHEQLNSVPRATSVVEEKNNTPRLAMTGSGWRLVGQFSAHYALILEIEAENLSDAKFIAQQLAEPVKNSYNEILVYFFPPDGQGGLPDRRVQWTESTGYVEVNLRSQ